MSEFGLRAQLWLVHSLAASGLLLLLAACLLLVVRQPVRRRQIGSWAIRAALLLPLLVLAPSWLNVPLPARVVEQPAVAEMPKESAPVPVPVEPGLAEQEAGPAFVFVVPALPRAAEPAASAPPAQLPPTAAIPARVAHEIPDTTIAAIVYSVIAGGLLVRWLLGYVALRRLVARAQEPDARLEQLFAEQAGGRKARLRITDRLRLPVCCGLWQPTVMLPAGIARAAGDQTLRWVFAHELAHLRRGDPWTCFWFGLGQALFFPLPWFWWLKRQVGLCQEYLADAAAAGLAGRVEDYAEFLVTLSRSVVRPTRELAAATGVLGNSSDLLRRITMLLNTDRRLEGRCPRRWSLLAAGGFLSLAVLLSGVGVVRQTIAAPLPDKDDTKKDEPKKEQPKDDAAKKAVPKPGIELDGFLPQNPGAEIDPQQLQQQMQQQMQKAMEEINKRLQQRFPGGGPQMFGAGNNFNNPFGVRQSSGRLGVNVEKPSEVLVEQLDLPKGQGLVIDNVGADSAAAKAGIKANDILLEIGGKTVSSDVQEFRKQLGDIKANSPVDAVVLRKGRKETVKGVSLPEAREEPAIEGPFGLGVQIPQLPAMPALPNMNMPHLRAIPRPLGPQMNPLGGGKGSMLMLDKGTFTIQKNDDEVSISISGKVDEGKVTVNNVTIRDGNDHVNVDKVEAVPEKYKEQVQKLLKGIQAK